MLYKGYIRGVYLIRSGTAEINEQDIQHFCIMVWSTSISKPQK